MPMRHFRYYVISLLLALRLLYYFHAQSLMMSDYIGWLTVSRAKIRQLYH